VFDSITRLNGVRVASFAGLILLVVLVVVRSLPDVPSGPEAPSNGPRPLNAAAGEATEAGGSAQEGLGGTVARTPSDTGEPPLASGCFRGGSTRSEVRAVMGAPDTVMFGAWEYGRSSVTFGYGVVLDYSNQGDNLRLC